MAIKKLELYSSLWAICDELCGGMDATPLPQLNDEVAALAAKVAVHLKKMGAKL